MSFQMWINLEIALGIQFSMAVVDAGYTLSDPVLTTDQYHAELHSLWGSPWEVGKAATISWVPDHSAVRISSQFTLPSGVSSRTTIYSIAFRKYNLQNISKSEKENYIIRNQYGAGWQLDSSLPRNNQFARAFCCFYRRWCDGNECWSFWSAFKKSDSAFVIFVEPLDHQYRCLPLHILWHESGQATPDVQAAIAEVCEALWKHQVAVRYKCADGDKGHKEAHRKFFNDWRPLLETGGLGEALRFESHIDFSRDARPQSGN
jgi:hypothetical protein